MVVENTGRVLQGGAPTRLVPGVWRIEVRLEDGEDPEMMSKVLELAFGPSEARAIEVARGAFRRAVVRIGGYPREIAEARAESMKSRASLGGVNLDISIRKMETAC